MANQKTAVEWLITMLDNAGYLKQKPETSSVSGQGVLRIVNQAKEMEKQQRISDYYQGACDESDNHGAQYICESNAENWYNEQKQ